MKKVVILPINDKRSNYAHRIADALSLCGVSAHVDDTPEKFGKRLRNSLEKGFDSIALVGEEEERFNTITFKSGGDDITVSVKNYINILTNG